jgi:hypothetical protein
MDACKLIDKRLNDIQEINRQAQYDALWQAPSWGLLADTALDNVNRWADGLGKTASAIKAAVGGASSSGSGITASILYGGGAQYVSRQGGTSSSQTINVYLTVQGSVIEQTKLEDAVVTAVVSATRKGRLQDPEKVAVNLLNVRDRASRLASVSS